MKQRKIILIIITAIILLIINSIKIYATNYTLNASINKNEYTTQDKVNVKISLENVENINEIYGVIGKIEYDKDVFENDISNIATEWNDVRYNKDTGEFVVIRNSTIEAKKEIFEIELKIKENAKLGNTNISIKNVYVSDSKNDKEVNETNISINVKSTGNEEIKTTPTPTILPTDTPIVTPTSTPTTLPTNVPKETNKPDETNTPEITNIPTTNPSKTIEPSATPKNGNTIINKTTNIETGDKKPIIAMLLIIIVIILNIIYFKTKKASK